MSAESELLEKRKRIIQQAMPRYDALLNELEGRKGKVAKTKASIKAFFAGMDNHGISEKAFKEALKRVEADQEELQLFDQEASELEDWMRVLQEGGKLVEDEDEDGTVRVDDPSDDGDSEEVDLVEGMADAVDGIAGDADMSDHGIDLAGAPTAPVAETDDWEMSEEPDHVVHQRQQAAAADAQAAQATGRPRTARVGKGKGNVVELPRADPRAQEKIQAAQADAGADGFSADDIPMPQTELHRAASNGFVDRTEHLSLEEGRKAMGQD